MEAYNHFNKNLGRFSKNCKIWILKLDKQAIKLKKKKKGKRKNIAPTFEDSAAHPQGKKDNFGTAKFKIQQV